VLTGNLLKDPDYITGITPVRWKRPMARELCRIWEFPTVVPNDADRIAEILSN